MSDLQPWVWAQGNPILAVGGAVLALVVLYAGIRYGYRVTSRTVTRLRQDPASRLTVVAAGIATAVSASGMWQFFDRIMPSVPWPVRVVMFAFIEVAVITSAVRARDNMREHGTAGIDGIAVWVLTLLSAVLSTMEAASIAEGLFRLASPLVAAWLWERGMAVEHRRRTGRARINWRITPERIMVRLGLAEASDRTAGEVDAHRRVTRVALAAFRLRQLDPESRRYRRAARRLNKRTAQAVEHAALTDPERATSLMRQLGALYGAPRLATVNPPAPWDVTVTQVDPDPDPGPRPLPPGGRLVEPTSDDPGVTVEPGHDPDPDPVTPPPPATLLPALATDADKIRTAFAVLGSEATPKDVMTWLADHGVSVRVENVRTVLRRERIKMTPLPQAAPVLTLHKGSN
ncbi:hypothetical protein [Microtetraspora malaysiensis]|uniref:hypothetical protein n=1 Tax=Microtetraspora malaysiensis TaxID=161358 RepID=UPI003D90CDDC